MTTQAPERTCDHRSLEGCYMFERALFPTDLLHCNCCDHEVEFPKDSHPETANPKYDTPCPKCAKDPRCAHQKSKPECWLHWHWACNAEIGFEEHQRGLGIGMSPDSPEREHGP